MKTDLLNPKRHFLQKKTRKVLDSYSLLDRTVRKRKEAGGTGASGFFDDITLITRREHSPR
jgi:hypothetical protein